MKSQSYSAFSTKLNQNSCGPEGQIEVLTCEVKHKEENCVWFKDDKEITRANFRLLSIFIKKEHDFLRDFQTVSQRIAIKVLREHSWLIFFIFLVFLNMKRFPTALRDL